MLISYTLFFVFFMLYISICLKLVLLYSSRNYNWLKEIKKNLLDVHILTHTQMENKRTICAHYSLFL